MISEKADIKIIRAKTRTSSIVYLEKPYTTGGCFMSVNFKQIGRRVKEIRKSRGLSQADLAERIDMSVPYISHIETATKKASLVL